MSDMKKKKSRHPDRRPETHGPTISPARRRPDFAQNLVRAIVVFACLALLAPSLVSNDFYRPHVFPKSILFRISVQAMVLLYVALALISPAHRPRFNRVTRALLAWFGVMAFCSLPGISANAWKSWWGEFARMDGMFAQLHLLAFFFVLVQSLKRERDWLTLFCASMVSSVFMGMTAVSQIFGTDGPARAAGATGNPDFFGAFMMLHLCIGLYFLFRKDRANLYPWLAKKWLFMLIAFDAALVVFSLLSGADFLSIIADSLLVSLLLIVVHVGALLWFLLR